MKTISIIIIAIVISIAICTKINIKNKYLKSSSSLKAANNLGACTTEETPKHQLFDQPIANAAYVLYNVVGTKYSYINQNTIAIVDIQSAYEYAKFKSIDYYTYTYPTITGNDKIANIVGSQTKHLEFDTTGIKLSDKSIFYETNKEPNDKYYIQLVNIAANGGTTGTTIQSTCTFVDYTATPETKPVIATITPFISSDWVSPFVMVSDRNSVLKIEDISGKRMTKVNDKKYNTFYMKNTKMCSISYDGVSIYTVYYSEYTAASEIKLTPASGTLITPIPEGTKTKYLSYTLECKGDDGSKECTKLSDSTIINMEYTMVISKTATKPVYVFKNKINFGSSSSTDKLSMEPAAIEEIAKTWDGCVIGIEKVNNIRIYKYNIIILFIISLLYIL